MCEIEHILAVKNQLGEGPVWHPEQHCLYWVDIEKKHIYRYWARTGESEKYSLGIAVTALGFRSSGGFIAATSQGFAYLDLESLRLQFILNPEADRKAARMNDGAVDPNGCFWAGTMSQEPHSALYRLDQFCRLEKMIPGIRVSNGIGWSPDATKMYFTDSPRRIIYKYDFDRLSSDITNPKTFTEIPNDEGFPDGLTVDTEGCVWSARWGGGKIVRYDPDGTVESEVILPVTYPTSCTFGGVEMNEMYVTSAWTALTKQGRAREPQAGDLFRIRTDVVGLREMEFLG